jgi:hypothetical protein
MLLRVRVQLAYERLRHANGNGDGLAVGMRRSPCALACAAALFFLCHPCTYSEKLLGFHIDEPI